MMVLAMRIPYAFCSSLAELKALASFRVRKAMSNRLPQHRYVSGNGLGPLIKWHNQVLRGTPVEAPHLASLPAQGKRCAIVAGAAAISRRFETYDEAVDAALHLGNLRSDSHGSLISRTSAPKRLARKHEELPFSSQFQCVR